MVELRDPLVNLESFHMWRDHLPESKKADPAQLVAADGMIDALQKSQQKIQFEADSLALARDAS